MPISRRLLLLAGAAACVAPLAPRSAAPSVPLAPPVPPAPPPAPEYGYSLDGAYWYTGFTSRQDAIDEAAALLDGAGPFRVAEVEWHSLYFDGDFAERAVDALANGFAPWEAVAEEFIADNEENDFEGDFTRAAEANSHDLKIPVMMAISSALCRIGRHAVANIVDKWEVPDAGALNPAEFALMEQDKKFAADLKAAVQLWASHRNLEVDLHSLSYKDEQFFGGPET